MDPPAFRVEISNDGDRRRFILLTQDGKRFGGREPVAREFGMMDGLTEQAAVLLSPLYIFQPFTPFGCSPARVVGQEIILNRSSVRIRCLATGERHDFWLDDETGLILRIEPVSTSPGKREVWAGSRNSRWIRRSIPRCSIHERSVVRRVVEHSSIEEAGRKEASGGGVGLIRPMFGEGTH